MKGISQTSEEYISVSCGCIRFIDVCRFLSSSLDKLINSLFEIKRETLKNFEEEIPDNEIIFNKIKELELLITDDKYENESIEKLNKEFPDEMEK